MSLPRLIRDDESEVQRLYWTIGEVADLCHVAPSKIRFYEAEFKLTGHRNKHGQRQYTTKEIELLRAIVGIMELGFTLKAMGRLVESGSHLGVCLEILQVMMPLPKEKRPYKKSDPDKLAVSSE